MDIEKILYRIILGYYNIYIDNKIYKVIVPDNNIKNQAHDLYLSIIDDNKFDTSSWISKSIIDNLLKIYNIWNDEKEKQLDSLKRSLELNKIELYLKFIDIKNRERFHKSIDSINKNINKLYSEKTYFDYLTLEYYANILKNQFIIINTVYDENDNRIFDTDLYNVNSLFLEKVLYEIHTNNITIEDLKKLAKHDFWRSYWDSNKKNTFNGPSISWTDEQRLLVNLTQMYDSIREHPECPTNDVFNDNHALDGWMLYQKQKTEIEKKQKDIETRLGLDKKKGRAEEVFIMSSSKEQNAEIYALNDNETRKEIAMVAKTVNEKGSMAWHEVPFMKRRIDEAREQLKSQHGGK